MQTAPLLIKVIAQPILQLNHTDQAGSSREGDKKKLGREICLFLGHSVYLVPLLARSVDVKHLIPYRMVS